MRRACVLVLLAACGGDDSSGPPLVVTTTFLVTDKTGSAPTAPIDPLYQQTVDFAVEFPKIQSYRGDEADTIDCISTVVVSSPGLDTAQGDTAPVFQAEVLDMLGDWDVRLQLCTSGAPSIRLHSEIDAFNFAIGCGGIPESARVKNRDGYPELTTFTATDCNATIYDVARNRILSANGFTMQVTTGPAELP